METNVVRTIGIALLTSNMPSQMHQSRRVITRLITGDLCAHEEFDLHGLTGRDLDLAVVSCGGRIHEARRVIRVDCVDTG